MGTVSVEHLENNSFSRIEETGSYNKVTKMSTELESSDEEAPEAISFGKSREEAISILKEAAELSKSTHKQKKVKEEKRKRRQERKDEKAQSEHKIKNEETLRNLREKAKEALSEGVKEMEHKSLAKNSKKLFTDKDAGSDIDENDADDFIPLNSSKPRAKRTSREMANSGTSNIRVEMVSSKRPKVFAAESVLNFKETMLYGAGSRVKRETAKSVIARNEKVKLIGSNRLCSR